MWRLDGAAECRRVAMRPADGGWWRGDLPGAEAGQLVAFHVEARGADASGRSARYPEAAEGLVRFGEEPTDGTFGVYRLWVTASEVERWYAQNRDSNEPRDMTFVAGNDRVVYGAGAEYGGSSWNGKSYPRPGTASSFIDYKADFPKDEPFLGDDGLVLATPGNRGNDKTAVKEQFAYALLRRLGRPSLHRRFVHVLFNGVAQNPMKIHEDTEKPNGSVLEHLFPDKDDGRLYKLDDWFEYDVDAFTNFSTDSAAARLAVYRGADGAYKTARYRWPWLPRACDNFQPSDYTAFFGLLDAVNAEPALSDEDLEAVFNAEALAEVLAVNHFICNNDSYGYGRGKNMYLYEGPAGWEFVGWDMDYSFGDNGVSLTTTLDPTSPSFPCGDPVAKAILQRPVNLRRYWEAIRLCAEAADSSSPECAEARAKFNALAADGAVVRDLEANFFAKMAERRAFAVESAASVESVESVAGVASVAGGRSGTTATQKAADGVVEDPVAEPAAFGLAAERGGRVVPRILAVQQPDTTVTWWPCAGAASALGRLYVDSHIRLMPWGEDADPTEYLQPDERFRLWTQLDETGRTNLFVTALQYDDDGWETFVGTNVFRIANSIDLSGETWRRLTVRAVADVTRAKARNPEVYPEGVQGFLVWLDGELLRTAPDDGSFTDDYVNFLAYEPDPAWGWLDWESPVDREVADLLQSGTVFADLRGAEAGGVSDVGFFGLGAIGAATFAAHTLAASHGENVARIAGGLAFAVSAAGSNTVSAANTMAFTALDKYITETYYLPEFGIEGKGTLRVGIVGKHALSNAEGLQKLEGAIAEGLRLIVMQQTAEVWSMLGFKAEDSQARQMYGAFLDRVDDVDLNHWAGAPACARSFGNVMKHDTRRGPRWTHTHAIAAMPLLIPQRGGFIPMVRGEFDMSYTGLLKLPHGKGAAYFCAFDFEKRVGAGRCPAATKVAQAVFSEIQRGRVNASRRVVTDGAAAKRLADALAERYFGYDHVYWGGTLDASCEDKEGAFAAFQGYAALLRHAVRTKDAAAERRYARLARHAMNLMLTYTMVWDATYPPGRLSDHAFKSTGWTVVSAQNQHLDAFGVLTTPEIWRMGEYLKDGRLKRLARVMYCSCFQLTDASGSLGEQIQHTNFAQLGKMDDVNLLRGGYAERWTVFWLTAHFLNAAASFECPEDSM